MRFSPFLLLFCKTAAKALLWCALVATLFQLLHNSVLQAFFLWLHMKGELPLILIDIVYLSDIYLLDIVYLSDIYLLDIIYLSDIQFDTDIQYSVKQWIISVHVKEQKAIKKKLFPNNINPFHLSAQSLPRTCSEIT